MPSVHQWPGGHFNLHNGKCLLVSNMKFSRWPNSFMKWYLSPTITAFPRLGIEQVNSRGIREPWNTIG